MGKLVQAAKADELEDGTMKKVLVEGQEILVARIGDKYYAADNRCSHLGGNLSEGELKGTIITCPRHGSQFDLSDGRVIRWLKGSGVLSALGKVLKPPKPIRTYRLKIENNRIMVEIQPRARQQKP